METLTAPDYLEPRKKRALRLKYAPYLLIDNVLFWRNSDGVLLQCLDIDETEVILKELHSGPAGGHFGGETTAHKILRAGYYWPTLFRDSYTFVRKCQECQLDVGRVKKPAFPLQLVSVERPFQQWGIDIVGPINPPSSKQHKYIITATDYFTHWEEAAPLRVVNTNQVILFLEFFIITRFGIPNSLVFDNASYFSSIELTQFASEKGIRIRYSAN